MGRRDLRACAQAEKRGLNGSLTAVQRQILKNQIEGEKMSRIILDMLSPFCYVN